MFLAILALTFLMPQTLALAQNRTTAHAALDVGFYGDGEEVVPQTSVGIRLIFPTCNLECSKSRLFLSEQFSLRIASDDGAGFGVDSRTGILHRTAEYLFLSANLLIGTMPRRNVGLDPALLLGIDLGPVIPIGDHVAIGMTQGLMRDVANERFALQTMMQLVIGPRTHRLTR